MLEGYRGRCGGDNCRDNNILIVVVGSLVIVLYICIKITNILSVIL